MRAAARLLVVLLAVFVLSAQAWAAEVGALVVGSSDSTTWVALDIEQGALASWVGVGYNRSAIGFGIGPRLGRGAWSVSITPQWRMYERLDEVWRQWRMAWDMGLRVLGQYSMLGGNRIVAGLEAWQDSSETIRVHSVAGVRLTF